MVPLGKDALLDASPMHNVKCCKEIGPKMHCNSNPCHSPIRFHELIRIGIPFSFMGRSLRLLRIVGLFFFYIYNFFLKKMFKRKGRVEFG